MDQGADGEEDDEEDDDFDLDGSNMDELLMKSLRDLLISPSPTPEFAHSREIPGVYDSGGSGGSGGAGSNGNGDGGPAGELSSRPPTSQEATQEEEGITVEMKVLNMIRKMGYVEGRGLGKSLQGDVEPLRLRVQSTRAGLDYSAHRPPPRSPLSFPPSLLLPPPPLYSMSSPPPMALTLLQRSTGYFDFPLEQTPRLRSVRRVRSSKVTAMRAPPPPPLSTMDVARSRLSAAQPGIYRCWHCDKLFNNFVVAGIHLASTNHLRTKQRVIRRAILRPQGLQSVDVQQSILECLVCREVLFNFENLRTHDMTVVHDPQVGEHWRSR